MPYVIQNAIGNYWTGEHFGAPQAVQTYDSIDELPAEVDGAEIEIYSNDDIRYFADDSEAAVAGVMITAGHIDD